MVMRAGITCHIYMYIHVYTLDTLNATCIYIYIYVYIHIHTHTYEKCPVCYSSAGLDASVVVEARVGDLEGGGGSRETKGEHP